MGWHLPTQDKPDNWLLINGSLHLRSTGFNETILSGFGYHIMSFALAHTYAHSSMPQTSSPFNAIIMVDHRMGIPKGKALNFSDMQLRTDHITILHRWNPTGGASTLSHGWCNDVNPTKDRRMGKPKGKEFSYSKMQLRSDRIIISHWWKPRGRASTLS